MHVCTRGERCDIKKEEQEFLTQGLISKKFAEGNDELSSLPHRGGVTSGKHSNRDYPVTKPSVRQNIIKINANRTNRRGRNAANGMGIGRRKIDQEQLSTPVNIHIPNNS